MSGVGQQGDEPAGATEDRPDSIAGIWAALAVRSTEVDQVRRLIVAAALVGFALVCFFSGSNALFLDKIGADALPWVYLVNAPIVIAAGFGYAAWSRRAATKVVLQGSIWMLTAVVTALWIWALLTKSSSAAFALAVGFRFLFIFGFLGLWEICSAVFDVRQAKRLFPAIALGSMVAFMIGGVLVIAITSLVGTVHLIGLSALFFALYSIAFARAMAHADFEAADASTPATPRQIVTDPFSRDLALMRSITILLVFVTEFIFYEQVAANFGSDATIARFLGIFMAGATLAMVLFTAMASGKYISRFGVGVGLASMPAGLAAIAILMGLYGAFFGVNGGFFALAIFANLANMILANAIETPVGAVMYQPMPIERRMPVRVAVDGWLGSVALIGAGLLLLLFDALNFSSVLPFVWLLAIIGIAGVVLARRLYGHYLAALAEATTVAFSGSGPSNLLGDLNEGRRELYASMITEDPAAAFAMSSLVQSLDDNPLTFVLPDLALSHDSVVATMALDALATDPRAAAIASEIVVDEGRPIEVRAAALRCLVAADPIAAVETAQSIKPTPDTPLTVQAAAVRLGAQPDGSDASRLHALSDSADPAARRSVARTIGAMPANSRLNKALTDRLVGFLDDEDPMVRSDAFRGTHGRVGPDMVLPLLDSGRHPENRRHVVLALATGGSTTVDTLESVIDELPDGYVVDLVDHVYAHNTRRPTILYRFLDPTAPSAIRRAGFDAARHADVSLPATINRLLQDDVAFAQLLTAAWRDAVGAHAGPPLALLDVVLADEFAATRRAIWAGLRLAGQAQRVTEIEYLAAGADDDTRANAIEALDTFLAHETRQMVVPLLEPRTIDEATAIASDIPEPQDRTWWLQSLRDDPRVSTSTRQLLAHHLSGPTAELQPNEKAETSTMATTIERVLALKRVDIFATLPYEILAELADVSTQRDAARGTAIITEGDFGDELFALTEGSVRVERPGGSTTLAAGTVFGELAILDPGPRSATVTAEDDCVLLVVTRPMLLALTDRRPEVMAEIARVLSARLRNNS